MFDDNSFAPSATDTQGVFDASTDLVPTAGITPASGDFFAPVDPSKVGRALFDEYAELRRRVEQVADQIHTNPDAVEVFLIAQREAFDRCIPKVTDIFDLKAATSRMDAQFWQRVMEATDIWDHLPQARRSTWYEAIRSATTPPFTPGNVEETLRDLLLRRESFFAERVDGIFQGLSGTHVTNRPEGFSRRMIVDHAFNSWGSPTHAGGLFHDLRGITRRFMGCTSLSDSPCYLSDKILENARNYSRGQWVVVDGGALRVRCYKKGTMHLEVHPDMAWRLNAVLASIHPQAIPASARQRPSRASGAGAFKPLRRPISWSVLSVMSMSPYGPSQVALDRGSREAREEAARILEGMGGVWDGASTVRFDYDVTDAYQELVASGLIPDAKTHQYYPTPADLAAAAIAAAQIGPQDTCLEPSAGQGALAELMPAERTTCVEFSRLHCAVLAGKGLEAVEADFLAWAPTAPTFDRIVMNPPFSRQRAVLHLEAAAGLLNEGGRLVAILPASMRDKAPPLPEGFEQSWSQVHHGAFANTSMSVAILTAVRKT